jgi:NADP-dependent 3-hydroxy acid dehydrogenase YdfG
MHTILTGKITFVADGTGTVGMEIVSSLLIADATVIVPAKSINKVNRLKEKVAAIQSGKLITFLTDYPEYDKAIEVVECMEEKYGQIDLAVIVFDSPKACHSLTKLSIKDWQQMADDTINAGFVCAHVFLNSMKKRKHGMYISISNAIELEKKSASVLKNIAISTQVELAKAFAAEVKEYGIQYHHLFIQPATAANKNGQLIPADAGNFIVDLFGSKNADHHTLFQWLPGNESLMEMNR